MRIWWWRWCLCWSITIVCRCKKSHRSCDRSHMSSPMFAFVWVRLFEENCRCRMKLERSWQTTFRIPYCALRPAVADKRDQHQSFQSPENFTYSDLFHGAKNTATTAISDFLSSVVNNKMRYKTKISDFSSKQSILWLLVLLRQQKSQISSHFSIDFWIFALIA